MNVLFALLCIVLFIVPSATQLIANRRARRSRDLSVIPHQGRHLVALTLRFALIVAAFVINLSHGVAALHPIAYLFVAAACAVSLAASVTDRRLHIDAETGLATWQKISLPFVKPKTRINYIDNMSTKGYDGERYLDLWGLDRLAQHWSVNYNGSVSHSGNYSEKTMRNLVATVNQYLEAFKRHDTDAARTRRRRFRETNEAKLAPARKRLAAKAERSVARETAAKRARETKIIAKKASREAKRQADIDAKFA